jgi:hypothetical protein
LQLLLFLQLATPQLRCSYLFQRARHTVEPLLAQLGPASAAARQQLSFAYEQVSNVILDLRAPTYQVLPVSDQRPPLPRWRKVKQKDDRRDALKRRGYQLAILIGSVRSVEASGKIRSWSAAGFSENKDAIRLIRLALVSASTQLG